MADDNVEAPEIVAPVDGNGEKASEDQKKAKIEFTPEQQSWLAAHSDLMYAKGRKNAEKELGGKLAETQSKIDALTGQLEAAKKPKVEDTKKADEEVVSEKKRLAAQIEELQMGLATLRTRNESLTAELDGERTKIKEGSKKSLFEAAIPEGIQFFKPDHVFRLMDAEGVLRFSDKGDLVVINTRTGEQRLNPTRDMEPMTLSEAIEEFARQNPHQVRSGSAGGGTGQGESRNLAPAAGKAKTMASLDANEFEALVQRVKAGTA